MTSGIKVHCLPINRTIGGSKRGQSTNLDRISRSRIKIPSEAGSSNILEYEAERISATDATFRKRSQMTADLDSKLGEVCQELLTDPYSTIRQNQCSFSGSAIARSSWRSRPSAVLFGSFITWISGSTWTKIHSSVNRPIVNFLNLM
jgi:hypothetical protein